MMYKAKNLCISSNIFLLLNFFTMFSSKKIMSIMSACNAIYATRKFLDIVAYRRM